MFNGDRNPIFFPPKISRNPLQKLVVCCCMLIEKDDK